MFEKDSVSFRGRKKDIIIETEVKQKTRPPAVQASLHQLTLDLAYVHSSVRIWHVELHP